jgi:hypothetical protein
MVLLLPEEKCPPHVWEPLQADETTEERLQKLEKSKQSGDRYHACLARKFQNQGKNVEISIRFKCSECGEYQEVDLIVAGTLVETKSGNQTAGKRQTLNYVDISRELFNNSPVKIYYQSAARAIRDAPHVARWGAEAVHEPCP